MAMKRSSEVISDKFNVDRICTSKQFSKNFTVVVVVVVVVVVAAAIHNYKQ
jgi:hypothetical protein